MEGQKSPWVQAFPAILGMLLLMIWSGQAREAAVQGVKLSLEVVFPSLFPFFVLSRRLTRSGILRLSRGNRLCGRLFGVSAAGMGALLMGFCGGYPLGVDTVCGLYQSGQLGREEAQRLIRFVNNTGPAFFFGMVGAVLFQSARVCGVLYLIHVLSAVLTGLLLARTGRERTDHCAKPAPLVPEPLPESVRQAFFAVCQLCGYVVFFSVALAILLAFPPVQWLMGQAFFPGDILRAFLSGTLDLPNGIAAIARIGNPTARFFLCTAAIGWGGFCVHMQAAGLWQRAGLEPRGYYWGKLMHMAVSLALAFPAAGLLFGGKIPLWPGFVPLAALILKRTVAFFDHLGYNTKNTSKRRLCHAFSEKN